MASPGRNAIVALASLLTVAGGGDSFAMLPHRDGAPLDSHCCSTGLQAEKFLGFGLGEQRRYVLGPSGALSAREAGSWAITLDEIDRPEGGSPEGVFLLSHEWQAAVRFDQQPHTITAVSSHGTVRLNGHGFPLFIRYQTGREISNHGPETYTIDYRYEAGQYRKLTMMDGGQRVDEVPIRGSDTLDLQVPAGLYAFLPSPPECRDRHESTGDPPARGDPRPPAVLPLPKGARVLEIIDCQEPLFANPGLLGLTMPALWESRGEREFLFFTPLGPTGEMEGTVTASVYGGRVPSGSTPPSRGQSAFADPRRMGDTIFVTPSQYREVESLRFGDRVRVRVGNRTRDVWTFTGPDRLGVIYVDDAGVVLRIDLPGEGPDAPQKWIRLLWPNEY